MIDRRVLCAAFLCALTPFLAEFARAEGGGEIEKSGHWKAEKPVGGDLPPVDSAALAATPRNGAEWLHFGGDLRGLRHSPIAELTPSAVRKLEIAWAFQTGVPGQLEANPIIYDGVMYTTSARNRLFALDAATGAVLWRYDHPQPDGLLLCCGPANRGVAIAGDAVIMGTLDARLIAFHRRTGEILWNTEVAPFQDGYSVTSAPFIVNDVAIMGIGGAEYGVRGFFDGYDVKTGKRLWRHYTVPAAGEPGAETWAGNSNEKGGGSSWATGAYDPELDTLYVAVGNPAPDWNGDVRKGDNLFTDSLLAIDPKTGERKWYFQFTPHDVWDYDGNSELWLVDLSVDGKPVKAVVQANRNGYLYVIDRTDGSFLRATQYVEQLNWATIDEKGRPVVDPKMVPVDPGVTPERICPGLGGGNNAAYAGSVNPSTNIAYVTVIESCSTLVKSSPIFVKGVPFFGGVFAFPDAEAGTAYGHVSAIDLNTGETVWKYRDEYPMMAGSLSTAGGVVFTGNTSGHALALDAKDGSVLWRFPMGSGVRSHPVAYQIDGTTYVAIGSGGGGLVQTLAGEDPMVPYGSTLFVFRVGK
ncbi:MAG: PQQ-dependent dehydrogenase, methanol/ethanol family [Myxococcales bacterium]|nr:PQQ-dependent dehydrogenase, methanol/ethanol family [Myxococcales bacterium]